jgi:hypothetical protein
MTLAEIKQAIEDGKKVHWANTSYEVVKSKNGELLIKHIGGHCIGLTWTDEKTLNGKEEEFFIEEPPHPNRLIAEFMGVKPKLIKPDVYGYCDSPFISITENNPEKVMEGIVKYVKYDSSWDWLMPVIEKCSNIASELDEWERYWKITDNIPRIDTTYEATLDFIKWYNNNNK